MSSRVDVAIIGYGPVGALLANLLGQAGLQVAVFEREGAAYPVGRAVHYDAEVMRVFQSVGLAHTMEPWTSPCLGQHYVNAQGQVLLQRDVPQGPGPQGWDAEYMFHQPDLERVLRAGVECFANVQVHLEHEAIAITQAPEGANVQVQELPNGAVRDVAASYVIGCDGARSLVRKTIGATFEDLGFHRPWLVLDLVLRRPVELSRYGIQYCNPARPATCVFPIGNRRRWEIMLMPGDDPTETQQPARVWELLRLWLTPEDAVLERAAVYTFHSLIAHGWRQGRLLLAGDAAHQTPPFYGQGMCHGMRDAANLAWKLTAVLAGRARDKLLDSYEVEREPHARAWIEQVIRIGNFIQTTDPATAAARDRQMPAGTPKLLTVPRPRLGPSLHGTAAPPAGELFPQPRLPDGRLLDDAVGTRFAILGPPSILDAVSPATCQRWAAADAQVLVTTNDMATAGHLLAEPNYVAADWLRQHDARAVIVRPDRYVLGVAADAAELDIVSEQLPLV